jgi:UDP-N-acetylmuramate dehydrogenase
MQNLYQINLSSYNSFAISQYCKHLIILESLSDLELLTINPDEPVYILGEGSNSLFIDDFAGTVLHPLFKGIKVTEQHNCYELEVAAGENWHQLVEFCLSKNILGLENLALIPGSVGAAPVQNIGAYGCELADFCSQVSWYEFSTKNIHKLSAQDCGFGYRSSIFKQELKGKGLITSITLTLPKKWQAQLEYAGLSELATELEQVSAMDVFNRVVAIRSAKLPEPKVLPNAGSFFKNPVVERSHYLKLREKFEAMPCYPLGNNKVKLAAGWLIEQAGLKGYRQGDAGVHTRQALVLVNHGQATGSQIWQLAQYVQEQVFNLFAVKLEPEVRLINKSGEVS